jgi:hypothetical protein
MPYASTWPIVSDALDTHPVAQNFPVGMSFGGRQKHFNIDGSVYVGVARDFWLFPFLELGFRQRGDHSSERGFLDRMVLHFYFQRLFGREDPSLIL